MPAVDPVCRPAAPAAALAAPSAWCDDGDYARWFRSLADAAVAAPRAQGEDVAATPASALHRLLVHVEATLSAPERVALYEALWRCAAACETGALQAADAAFGGRRGQVIAWLAQPLPQAAVALARAHLDGCDPFPADPGFASAWLARHALADDDDDAHWLIARRAQLAAVRWGAHAGDAQIDAVRARCAAIADRGATTDVLALQTPGRLADALRLALDLELAAGDETGAVRALAACVRAGVHRDLPPATLLRWLEAGSAWPLALADSHQRVWLRPAWLHQPGYRARMAGALHRPALRARWQALRCALGDAAAASGAHVAAPAVPADPQPEPGGVLYALSVLDATYALAERGEPVERPAARLLRGDVLGAAARAALQRRCAIEAVDRIDPQAAALALADARGALGDAQDARVLQQLLLAIDAPAAQAAACSTGLAADADWFAEAGAEARLWAALAQAPHPHLQPLALAQLAALHDDGSLVPGGGPKRQQLEAADAAWSALLAHPAHAARARGRLAEPRRRLMRAAESTDGGRQHLWLPSAQPDARRLLIVFSCVESHHRYAQVSGLAGAMPGHHLLFVNNPELNWYSDGVFDAVARLIEQRVLPRFAREDVTCYFGSMGGHAALKFALHFGFQAIAFNPQVDLRLWAAFRPQQRALLLGARAHAQVQDAPDAQFERSPACVFCGSSTPDREALRLWLQRVQTLRHGSFIVETVDDPHHAGLIGRLVPAGGIPALLDRTQARLRQLAACGARPPAHAEVPAALAPRFWQQMAQAPALKLELLLRDGRLFVADSCATGTLPAAQR